MRVGPLSRLIAGAARRPRLSIVAVAALAAGGILLALGVQPQASIGTLVSSSAPDFRATQLDQRQFGGDAIVILVREPVRELISRTDLATVSALEACLAGQRLVLDGRLRALVPIAPARAAPYGGAASPCGRLMRDRPAQVVYGPGTFLNRAVAAVGEQLATLGAAARRAIAAAERAAYALALRRGLSRSLATAAASAAGELEEQQEASRLVGVALGAGITSQPGIANTAFLERIVFGPAGAAAPAPQARFAYLFPNSSAALIQVRLRPGLSAAQQAHAIGWIRQAVAMTRFRLEHGGTYLVSGEPVVLSDLAGELAGAIVVPLVAALAVMALALTVLFGGRRRLLPLVLALAAAAITSGLTALLGVSLTIASVAVIPILIGVSVDYAIQFQSRAREFDADAPGRGDAVSAAGLAAAPTIAIAALATAAGFAVLLLSPVPMVRDFGVTLVVGIAVALGVTFTAGAAVLALPARRARRSVAVPAPIAWLDASVRGAAEIVRDGARVIARYLARDRGRALRLAGRHPWRVLTVAVVLAAAGWAVESRISVESDITRLVPPGMPSLRDLRTLERVSGTSGEIDVLVQARDVASPAVIGWMVGYENSLLSHFGFAAARGCAAATLCPALSLPDLFGTGGGGGAGVAALSASSIDRLLHALPRYFAQAVIARDRRYATLAFGIRLMPLARQDRVLSYMRAHLHPPAGVRAELAGLPVLAADASMSLSSPGRRWSMTLAGLLAVALVLAVSFRRPRRVLIPLVPVALVTGWSSLLVYITGIPLNPMSAALATLVLAVSTEFSVLVSERIGQERGHSGSLAEAVERAYRSTGRAVQASGLTAIAGFGVLVSSGIEMLREFGLVALVDLSVSLAGVLLVLPAVVELAERRAARGRARPSPARSRRAPLRRRAPVA